MAPAADRKRRGGGDERRPKKKIKIRLQKDYHSSSEDEDENDVVLPGAVAQEPEIQMAAPKSILKASAPFSQDGPHESDFEGNDDDDNVDELEMNTALNALREDEMDLEQNGSEEEQDEDSGSNSEDATSLTSSTAAKATKKRNDPDAFATSISKILSTKLTQPKRQEPILSRSKDVSATVQGVADSKLDQKARAALRAEKKQSLEKGRVKDVLAFDEVNVDTGALLEEEKRLKKTAQRGVVRLFNAVRAAQVKAEGGMIKAREEGVVGMQKREEKINEMSKQGFLDLISQGGKKVGAEA